MEVLSRLAKQAEEYLTHIFFPYKSQNFWPERRISFRNVHVNIFHVPPIRIPFLYLRLRTVRHTGWGIQRTLFHTWRLRGWKSIKRGHIQELSYVRGWGFNSEPVVRYAQLTLGNEHFRPWTLFTNSYRVQTYWQLDVTTIYHSEMELISCAYCLWIWIHFPPHTPYTQ